MLEGGGHLAYLDLGIVVWFQLLIHVRGAVATVDVFSIWVKRDHDRNWVSFHLSLRQV